MYRLGTEAADREMAEIAETASHVPRQGSQGSESDTPLTGIST